MNGAMGYATDYCGIAALFMFRSQTVCPCFMCFRHGLRHGCSMDCATDRITDCPDIILLFLLRNQILFVPVSCVVAQTLPWVRLGTCHFGTL